MALFRHVLKHLVHISSAACLVLAGCSSAAGPLGPPTAQGPVNWVVQAGASAQNEALQTLDFYPAAITIDAGDSVTWKFPAGEPHTVAFLGPRSAPPPPNDPSVPAPAGGNSYDGSAYTSSGFKLGGNTYTLTFPKPGTYKYYCLIHGEMVGTVVVQVPGAPYAQTPAQISGEDSQSISVDLQDAAAAVTRFPYPAGGTHLVAGISSGLGTTPSAGSVVRFLDGPSLTDTSVTVPIGTTVTWTNRDSNLPHTVTFAAQGTTLPPMDPGSPPSGGTTYDGSSMVNSGPLFPGQSYSLTFTKPGIYPYQCLFHDDTENMTGTVVVQ